MKRRNPGGDVLALLARSSWLSRSIQFINAKDHLGAKQLPFDCMKRLILDKDTGPDGIFQRPFDLGPEARNLLGGRGVDANTLLRKPVRYRKSPPNFTAWPG